MEIVYRRKTYIIVDGRNYIQKYINQEKVRRIEMDVMSPTKIVHDVNSAYTAVDIALAPSTLWWHPS